MKKIIEVWNNLSSGKKIYTILWMFFGIMLVSIILIASLSTDADTIASIALIFLISLISAIFSTVYVNIKESNKSKKEKK